MKGIEEAPRRQLHLSPLQKEEEEKKKKLKKKKNEKKHMEAFELHVYLCCPLSPFSSLLVLYKASATPSPCSVHGQVYGWGVI